MKLVASVLLLALGACALSIATGEGSRATASLGVDDTNTSVLAASAADTGKKRP